MFNSSRSLSVRVYLDVVDREKEMVDKKKEALKDVEEEIDRKKMKAEEIHYLIRIAQDRVKSQWEIVESGKRKLKTLLDEQESTLEYLDMAEREKKKLKGVMEKVKDARDIIDQEKKVLEAGKDEFVIRVEERKDEEMLLLRKIKTHVIQLEAERKHLEKTKERLIEGKEQLKDDENALIELSREMTETVKQYDKLLKEIKTDKERLSQVRMMILEGREKIKEEYTSRRLDIKHREKEIMFERKVLDNKKAILKGKVREARAQLKKEYTDRIKFIKIKAEQGRQMLRLDYTAKMKDFQRRVGEMKKLGKELKARAYIIQEASRAKIRYEERYEALKDDERALAAREQQLRRDQRALEREREKFEREHALKMEAYAQNDADIEAEFAALEDMRDLIKAQQEELVKVKLQFLKETMYYECPVCRSIIQVKTSKRPLWVQCDHCKSEFFLKVKQQYPCPDCNETITVTTSKRPITVKCTKCRSEFIIRRPYPFEKDMIPDRLKEKVPV